MKFFLSLCATVALFSCSNPHLRDELQSMRDADQKVRFEAIETQSLQRADWKAVYEIDAKHYPRLVEIIETYGWPNVNLVGEAGSSAMWLLVQHQDENIAFQKRCFALLKEAVKQKLANPAHYAFLYDRIAVNEKRPQRFGTQWTSKDDKMVPREIEHPEKLEIRRMLVGLQTMADYQQELSKVYHHYTYEMVFKPLKEKKIEVAPYDPNWPRAFEKVEDFLRQKLGDVEVHHIGSTAVPGLCAKPIIDVVCIVNALDDALVLKEEGFVFKGELNIPLRYYFSKSDQEPKINLHVVERGHPFAKLNLLFRDYLRKNDEWRDKYAALKQRLVTDRALHKKASGRFSGYNLGKDQLIKEVITRSGFNDTIVNFCTHNDEWKAYYAFTGDDAINERDTYFVIYRGAKIVGAARVVTTENTFNIATIAGDEQATLTDTIHRWATRHNH